MNLTYRHIMHIYDNQGAEYEVQILWEEPSLSIFAFWKGIKIGKVFISIANGSAELIDVVIEHEVVVRYSEWRKLLGLVKKKNFRGRGLGTRLLQVAITELKLRGAQEVRGEMVGDVRRLTGWYRTMGFTQISGSNRIHLKLA